MSSEALSISEARRIALAAQGFDRPRPVGRAGPSHLRSTIRRLGLLQIDYVNVLTPSHYLVPFSRLGPYDTKHLHDIVYRRREFTEQWAHEASIVPCDLWPFLRHRRETHRARPFGTDAMLAKVPAYVENVLAAVRDLGPLTSDDIPDPDGIASRIDGAWFGSVRRAVLEAYFGRGVLAVAARLDNFARKYDLSERVIPEQHHVRHVEREEAQRELLRRAARALGVATAGDLADYYRMSVRDARPRLAELVGSGELQAVRVEGWREPALLYPQARLPRQIEASALLSPFDPVVWFRPRAARLFHFDFRFEIFVPKEKRRWGAYVLPFLLGERLVARVDLKSDRTDRRLSVLAAYAEPGADTLAVAVALAAELGTLAAWLGLDSVAVARRGNLARALAKAVRAAF